MQRGPPRSPPATVTPITCSRATQLPEARSHAIVVGFRREQLAERYAKIPIADIVGGKCIGCSEPVYVNAFGASAIRERDADVCCTRCEILYDADINHALIES